MLFNPNWKKEAKPDVHSLESLIQWMERKDPTETYVYSSGSSCLLAQYYRAKGYKRVIMATTFFFHGGLLSARHSTRLPYILNAVACEGEPTFGAALKRARVAQKQLHAA